MHADVDAGTHFAGYASLFGVRDAAGDIVMPGAFAQSLLRRGARGIRMLFQHDPAEPVGVWTRIAEDATGLRVEGLLVGGVRRARDLAALARHDGVGGLSIGFRTLLASGGRGGAPRRLWSVDLLEISLVTFPMLPGCRISGVR